MKTIWRNFLSVFRRFKAATLLNVLGLSIAFTAFMVIMMQVNYDYTFDSCQPEADAIYRMDKQCDGTLTAVNSRPLARAFTESSPHIKAGMIMSSWNSQLFYCVERNGGEGKLPGSGNKCNFRHYPRLPFRYGGGRRDSVGSAGDGYHPREHGTPPVR